MSSDAARTALRLTLSARRELPEDGRGSDGSTVRRSDEELLALCQSGKHEALGILFDRYSRLVLTIAFRTLKNRMEAEDLLQDVFLHIHEKSRNFDPAKGTGRTWIVHITYCMALDRRAHLSRRSFYNGTNLSFLQDTLQENLCLENRLSTQFSAEQLRREFEQLTDNQRQTLELFFFGGLTFREISEQIGDTLENVRHHYYRGMERLNKTEVAKALRRGK